MEKEILKTLLLKGIKDEFLELLNLIGKGDVFQLSYDDIFELCIRYSRGISKAVRTLEMFVLSFPNLLQEHET